MAFNKLLMLYAIDNPAFDIDTLVRPKGIRRVHFERDKARLIKYRSIIVEEIQKDVDKWYIRTYINC